jgi:predicted metalloprotease
MQWRGRRQSTNVEDQRGRRVSRGAVGIGGGGLLLILLLAVFLGQDPVQVLQQIPTTQVSTEVRDSGPVEESPAEAEQREFVSVVLADTEDVWNGLFQQDGRAYEEPGLVLFRDAVDSACGFAQAAVGPFYCPMNRKLYLDFAFFDELAQRFGAPGDFAQAYVIAHEVGHHVQTLLGISEAVRAEQQRRGGAEANALSVRLELQADCLAGVWASHANRNRILDPGDVEEGLGAASAIGDDRLQRQAQGTVVPESFTHGSSAQRVEWFQRGFVRGNTDDCDTFGASSG